MTSEEMTFWLALAGIGATMTGTLIAPIVAEKMRRKSARAERLLTERLAVYADVFGLTTDCAADA